MNNRKLILAFLIGLVSITSLSLSFSLAWYATSTRLFVDTIQVEIKGDRKLLLSTTDDIDSFKEDLYPSDLDAVGYFIPVSSMFSSRWFGEDVPEFYEYSNVVVGSDGVPSGPTRLQRGFLQQEVYLLSDDDVYVSIDPSNKSTYFKFNEDLNKQFAYRVIKDEPQYTYEEALNNLNHLIYALRYSIYDVSNKAHYIIDPFKDKTTYYGGTLDNDKDDYFDTYIDENGIYKEVLYGEINDRSLAEYHDVGENDIDIAQGTAYSSFNAKHAEGTKYFLEKESLLNGLTFKAENSLIPSDMESNDPAVNKMVIPLHRNEPKKIVLSIYLEGWDRDCINTTMGGSFISQIQFRILREA